MHSFTNRILRRDARFSIVQLTVPPMLDVAAGKDIGRRKVPEYLTPVHQLKSALQLSFDRIVLQTPGGRIPERVVIG